MGSEKAPGSTTELSERAEELVRSVQESQRARADLGAIFAHIAADNRSAAERWIARILEHTAAPLLGRIVPELAQADIRETYLRSYRIVYRTDGQSVWVPTVFEEAANYARRASTTMPERGRLGDRQSKRHLPAWPRGWPAA
ncbi:MAG TPA: type II toxin-antitoxin system RelE/ParE family toxin [Polyangiaceae bacterium]|nr:type II toxin-antitoxin system RelE/ParE family toxin [Polyangiaceae bacterium]